MTHTSTEQPEALRLADIVERLNVGVHSQAIAEEYSAAARELRRLHARVQELEFRRDIASACFRNISTASQAQRVPLSDEWIKELMGLVSRYGNLNYQECDADYREHQTKSERYAQDQRDTFSAIESKLRTIGITQEKQG